MGVSAMSSTEPAQVFMNLPGLRGKGRIAIDKWGIPHISAGCVRDAFFLQGFNAARDRLWQIDLWRKKGLGLLAADFGPGYLEQDRASRLFLYRGDMADEWRHYGDDAQEICESFAAGINAAIAAIEAGAMALPADFVRFGTRPAWWKAEDVVRIRTHSLSRNALSEWARYQILSIMGSEQGAIADQLRAPLFPPLAVDDWGDLPDAPLPQEAMDAYTLATSPVTFQPARLAASLQDAAIWSRPDGKPAAAVEGSNNWAVSAAHTATGRPLMASDPHRAFAAPSLRYLVHLEAPGLSVIGAGEPSSPGIMAGHNGFAAFSLTIFPADQEDLMVLQLAEGGYLHNGTVKAFREQHEQIPVRGHEDQPVTLRFAGDAPVLWLDHHHGLAIRTVATEAGTAPYMAALATMRCKSPESYREALHGWGAPTTNQVYADMNGEVFWQASGKVPLRASGAGIIPAWGDGRADWTGFLTSRDLPGHEAGSKGFVHSANEMNLPAGWQQDNRRAGHEWYRDGRADRVAEVLAAMPTDVAGSCALQTDCFSSLALRLRSCLPDSAQTDAATKTACELLQDWDGFMAADSAAAYLYAVWSGRRLYPALVSMLPEAVKPFFDEVEETAVVELFEGSRPELAQLLGLADSDARERILLDTLTAALHDCAADQGPHIEAWKWGGVHRARFVQPQNGATAGPLSVGGGISTVMMQAYEAPSFQPVIGASVRMVVDVGAWDQSMWINAPGQSADPDSPHSDDLAAIWAEGGYLPMLYSSVAIKHATEVVWQLAPIEGSDHSSS